MICTKEYINIMLNDPKNPCGHGIALAAALIDDLEGNTFLDTILL